MLTQGFILFYLLTQGFILSITEKKKAAEMQEMRELNAIFKTISEKEAVILRVLLRELREGLQPAPPPHGALSQKTLYSVILYLDSQRRQGSALGLQQ